MRYLERYSYHDRCYADSAYRLKVDNDVFSEDENDRRIATVLDTAEVSSVWKEVSFFIDARFWRHDRIWQLGTHITRNVTTLPSALSGFGYGNQFQVHCFTVVGN